MKKNNKKFENLQYSEESINLKIKILYFLTLAFKIAIFTPLIKIMFNTITNQFYIFLRINDLFLNLAFLIVSILISLASTKKEIIKDPLFLDDKVVVSNRKKSNGYYEDIYLDKFKLLIGFTVIFIIPVSFIASLTISSLICLILGLIPILEVWIAVIKYILTIVIFKFLYNTFYKTFLRYLRNKKE